MNMEYDNYSVNTLVFYTFQYSVPNDAKAHTKHHYRNSYLVVVGPFATKRQKRKESERKWKRVSARERSRLLDAAWYFATDIIFLFQLLVYL